MPITVFQRSEMKFILNSDQYSTLLPRLAKYMKADEHCKSGSDYRIYNLYYDTADDYLIRTSLSKPYYKEKLRLRSYQFPITPKDKVFMEIKKKTAQTVTKRRAVITLQEAYDFIENGKRPRCDTYMNAQVVNELEYFLKLHRVFPVSYISYDRLAFFGRDDKNFRITFDYDLTSRRNDLYLESGSYGDALLDSGQYLMEVKISGAAPKWLADLLAELKIYKTSFSKYGTEYKQYCLTRNESSTEDRIIRRSIAI